MRLVACRATKKTFPSFDAMVAESDVPVLVDFYATCASGDALALPAGHLVAGHALRTR